MTNKSAIENKRQFKFTNKKEIKETVQRTKASVEKSQKLDLIKEKIPREI